ncbi:hypothetical protein CEXT_169201 [Caerostris extrusa]|uniref:Uncharacterized protein n=1 Tax=Caerostris extrusa TaxID=172846 RepID=A0AAV4VKJ9_CAEEX|nr:hypothetical protein CEXT_169201 [Caerostris extrusa]
MRNITTYNIFSPSTCHSNLSIFCHTHTQGISKMERWVEMTEIRRFCIRMWVRTFGDSIAASPELLHVHPLISRSISILSPIHEMHVCELGIGETMHSIRNLWGNND